MRRWIVGAAIVLTVVAVAVGVALHRADAWITTHREWIAGRVGAAIGRPITFGAVGIRILPRIAVRVTDVEIGEDPAFSSAPFVIADAVSASVAIFPALVGRVVVHRIVVERPVVTIIRDADGYNVRSLGRRAGPSGRAERTERSRGEAGVASSEPIPRAEPEMLPIALTSGRILGGRVRLIDRRSGREQSTELDEVDATVAGLSPTTPASIDARAVLPGSSETLARVTGTVGPFDLGALPETPVDVVAEVTGVDVERARAELADVAAALPAPLEIVGTTQATLRVTGTAIAPAFEAEFDATGATVTWAEWFRKPSGLPLTVRAAGERVGDGARIDRLVLAIFDDDTSIHIDGEASPDRVALHVVMDPAEMGRLTTLVPALGESWRVRGTAGLDVRMRGSVRDGRTPALTGMATMRDLDVVGDRGVKVSGFTQTVTFEGDHARLPATTFAVNGTPVVAAGRFGPFGTERIGVSDLEVRIFDGRVRGRVDLDRRSGRTPLVDVDLRIDGIDVAKVAAMRAPGATSNVTGSGSGTVRVSGRGTAPDTLRPSLNGEVDLAVRDGALTGVNLVDRVLGAVAKAPGLSLVFPADLRARYPSLFGEGDTRFDEMTATIRFERGVARVVRSRLSARDYAIEGTGTLGLDGRIDGTAVLRLAPGASSELMKATGIGRIMGGATGRLAIPFAIAGTWPRVRVAPDVAGMAQAVPGVVVPKAVEEGVGRLLDGLFKR